MPSIKNFDELTAHLASKGTKSRVAVVWAEDDVTRSAVLKGLEAGIITATFVGCRKEIEADERLAKHKDMFTIVQMLSYKLQNCSSENMFFSCNE